MSHDSTRLGQVLRQPTASAVLDLGRLNHVGTLVDGLAARRGTAVAAILHTSHLLRAIPLLTRSQNALRSKSVLASRQALQTMLENMGFQGDQSWSTVEMLVSEMKNLTHLFIQFVKCFFYLVFVLYCWRLQNN